MNEFINLLMPYLVELSVVAVSSAATFLIKEAFKLIKDKNQYATARSIYFMVEQIFKGSISIEKKTQFDNILLDKIPGLKQEEVDRLRESICGEINAGFNPDK